MTENEKTRRLQKEITTSAKLAMATKGYPVEYAFKGYVAGIQYAINTLMGKEVESILPREG